MYPDPITPKSHPEILRRTDYDPFELMPRVMPPHPRVMVSRSQVEQAKGLVRQCRWAARCLEILLENARRDFDLPEKLPVPADVKLNHRAVSAAQRNALAWLLTGEHKYRERGIHAFRLFAEAYLQCPLQGADGRAAGGGLAESHLNHRLGQTYDLLAAEPLDATYDALFRRMLEETRLTSDGSVHYTCGNHNTWSLVGRLAVGSALGDAQHIHDALYGCPGPKGWRYGLIHQLRHDVLSDGLHWERTPGYHFYTMMGLADAADMCLNLGVDLWRAELLAQHQDDGQDLHRAYEPRGTKCLKAMFDAPFYQAFTNGDFSLIHDSGLANLRGAWIWGIIYDRAWAVYRDPKYAWLLHRIERDYPPDKRKHPGLPMPLNTNRADLDFVRLAAPSYLEAHFDWRTDCRISLRGEHRSACTLFPVHGSAVLRSDPENEQAVNAYLFWGPHSAGHMNPAALHLDIVARGRRITDAPRSVGYEDPLHLTWNRATVAQNTVTVDQQSMFPYDFDTDSIWEADRWRDRVSDGQLQVFQPEALFKAVRASSENAYEGVRLDRTVVVTGEFVLDVYRVTSNSKHQYDWSMHCPGEPLTAYSTIPLALGQRRGYRHLRDARELPTGRSPHCVRWRSAGGDSWIYLLPPQGARIILARDPDPPKACLGELVEPEQRGCLIVRARGRSALFLSMWLFDEHNDADLACLSGKPDGDLTVETRLNGRRCRWLFPVGDGARVTCRE